MNARNITLPLFSYGTLAVNVVMRSVIGRIPYSEPAILAGFKRHALKDLWYPAAVPAPGCVIEGSLLFGLTTEELEQIDRYEGPQYERCLVNADAASGTLRAWVFLLREEHRHLLSERPWDERHFRAELAEGLLRRILD